MPYSDNSELISNKLHSSLIQSGNDVILCLKVETFGRSPDEDPHSVPNLVSPDVRAFKVANEMNEGTSKLMLGAVRWSSLVTMSVVLTSGKIVVGPHHTSFHPHAGSHVWIKKGSERDMYNNFVRQTRSHFDSNISYLKHAGVHPRFLGYNTMPVTLSTLWSFKATTRGWSGVKLAAFVFNKLYSAGGMIMKSEVEEHLKEVRPEKDEDGSGIVTVLRRLVDAMRDEETRPVSDAVNKELKSLADKVQKEQARLDLTIVIPEVGRVIDGILKGKRAV